jgi:hypothetical protein
LAIVELVNNAILKTKAQLVDYQQVALLFFYLEPAEKVKCLIFSTVKEIIIKIINESELKQG